MEEIKQISTDAICRSLDGSRSARIDLKNALRDDLTKFLYAKTGRKPMILPVIMNM
jgi:ribonuclease J